MRRLLRDVPAGTPVESWPEQTGLRGNAQAQRLRRDLERRRRRAGQLAVELERQWPLGLHMHPSRAQHRDLAVPEVRAAVEAREVEREVELADVAPDETSSRPSSGSAWGQMRIPPPNARPFAQITLLATSSSGGASSTWTRNGTLRQAANVATVANRNDGVPPRRLDVRSARSATAPVSPQEPMLMYQREPSPPPCWNVHGRGRSCACARRAAARARVRPLGDAVGADRVAAGAEGRMASSGPAGPLGARPLTTSLTVPSPPSATTSSRPSCAALAASSVACPGPSVKTASSSSPRCRARSSRPGQRRPAAPFCAAGLTMTSARAVSSWPSRGPRGSPARSCAPPPPGAQRR